MMMTDEQLAMLDAPLDGTVVRTRRLGGVTLSYVPGHHCIRRANEIFGFGGWTRRTLRNELVSAEDDVEETGRDGQPTGRVGWRVAYLAEVEVAVRVGEEWVAYTGTGCGESTSYNSPGAAHEGAAKESETDATKRALICLGDQFGLALYDPDQEHVESSHGGAPRQTGGNGQSGSGHSDQGAPICEKCGSEMRRRSGKNGDFYGCSAYPRCKFTMGIDEAEATMAEAMGADEDEDSSGDDEYNPYDERSYDNGGSENRLDEQDGRPPDDPTQWKIESFEHFNTAVSAMEWPDADRKALYHAACNRLWSKPIAPRDLKPDQLHQVFVEMVEIDEEEAEVA
jgi:hypothetical protein